MARKSAASLGRPVFAVSYDDGWIGVLFPGIPQQVDILVVEVDGVPQIVGLRLDPQYVWLAKSTKDSAPTRLSRSLIRISQDGQRLEWNGPKDVDPTITADLLRSLPLRQLRAMAAAAEYGDGTGDWLEPFSVERTPGEPWPDDHYREVAETYRSAPSAPLKAIQTRSGRQPCSGLEVGSQGEGTRLPRLPEARRCRRSERAEESDQVTRTKGRKSWPQVVGEGNSGFEERALASSSPTATTRGGDAQRRNAAGRSGSSAPVR